jgi:hypothetical protein
MNVRGCSEKSINYLLKKERNVQKTMWFRRAKLKFAVVPGRKIFECLLRSQYTGCNMYLMEGCINIQGWIFGTGLYIGNPQSVSQLPARLLGHFPEVD